MALIADLLRTKAKPAYPEPILRQADAYRWSLPDYQLPEAQSELYQRLSWVAIAVDTVAEAAASQAFSVRRLVAEDEEEITNHPFELLLAHPNPLMSRFEFLVGTFAYRALTGNAYWYVNASGEGQKPDELWLLPSHQVRPVPDGRMYLKGYEFNDGHGQALMLPPWQIVHFKRFHPLNPFIGLSPIESLATVAAGDLAMQRWNAEFFGKDNAKIPSILTFADMIDNATWDQMQQAVRREWGGTKRHGPMMLRGTGTGAVQWIQAALSQKDMEFLAGRQATKEEIYSIFGKGLAAILDKNTTEANALAAKAVFAEFTLWPMLTSVAEVISNRLLPIYGENLVGEFEDPRKTDRLLELQERDNYAKYHTIDEVRKRWFQDDVLGDERGLALVAQIGPTTPIPGTETPASASTSAAEAPPTEIANAAAEPGQEPQAVLKSIAAKADLRRWREKTRARGRVTAFESTAIPAGLMQAVKAAQEALEQPERAFDFLKSVEQSWLDQEAIIKRKVQAVFAKYDGRFTDALLAGETDFPWDEFSAELTRALGVEISAAMAEEVMRQAEALHVGIEPGLVNAAAIDWARSYTYDLVKELRGTTEKGVTAAQAQIQATLQQSVGQFLETPKMTRADLEKLLAPTFGEARASMIAVTEVTRAASAATTHYQEYLGEHGLQMERVWHTRNDELVCPICGPLDGQPESVWAADFPDGPPSHVNCRCAVGLRAVPEESKSNA